ncbi:MAG: hypothetical protein SCM11_12705 [Bacillota bacterium]|nr:hypothetical protein [Bacillota bacterium]
MLVIIIIGVVWGLLLFKPVVDKNLALEIYLIGTGVATLLMLLAGIVFIVKARQFKRRGGRY